MGERKTATAMVERVKARQWLSTGQGGEVHGWTVWKFRQRQECQNDTSSRVGDLQRCVGEWTSKIPDGLASKCSAG